VISACSQSTVGIVVKQFENLFNTLCVTYQWFMFQDVSYPSAFALNSRYACFLFGICFKTSKWTGVGLTLKSLNPCYWLCMFAKYLTNVALILWCQLFFRPANHHAFFIHSISSFLKNYYHVIIMLLCCFSCMFYWLCTVIIRDFSFCWSFPYHTSNHFRLWEMKHYFLCCLTGLVLLIISHVVCRVCCGMYDYEVRSEREYC